MNHNQLERLPETFGGLESLERLGKREMSLHKADGALQWGPRRLTLDGNRLQQLPQSFGHLESLKSLGQQGGRF